ncbi:MAG: lectin-like domain-containing protein [Chitinophagales bacterium]
MKVFQRILCVIVLLVINNPIILAQKTWTGASDTNWADPSNWNPIGIPAATDDVVIPNTANAPILQNGTTASVKSLSVNANANLTIQANGTLNIDGSSGGFSDGLFNQGLVTNSGEIHIGALSAIVTHGIFNDLGATFTNETGGIISIDQTGNNGIFNTGATFVNKANIDIGGTATIGGNGIENLTGAIFTNDTGGEINIDQINSNGISNDGTAFINKATINIGATTSIGGFGIRNLSTFVNETNGEINIDQTGGAAWINESGHFTNKSALNIGQNITIQKNGIVNAFSSTIINEVGGIILIDRAKLNGILTTSSSTFTNKGDLYIGSSDTIENHGIENLTGAIFTNDTGAELRINRVDKNGILNNTTSTFTNKGDVHIGGISTIGNNGIENVTNAVFTNDTGANIHIDRTSQIGLANNNADFTNKANIYIGGIATIGTYGLYSIFGASFINETGAELHIDQTNLDGIYNYFSSPSILNKACAKIFITEKISGDGIFTNLGFLFSDFNGSHINTGTFTNQGTIEDLQGAFNGVSMNNEDLILAPVCGNMVIPNILQIGTNNSFTVSTDWYSDAALTTDVGDYNQSSNTFTSNLPAGNHTFYMQITDNINACTETLAIQVSGKITPNITGNLSYCNGANTTLDAGNWNSYAWSNNQTSQTIIATVGTYTVTVSNSNGLTGTDQVTVTENTAPTPQIVEGIPDNTFSFVGDGANLSGGCYQLTTTNASTKGAIWSNETIDLSQSFVATFQVDMGFVNAADGITFALHRDPLGTSAIGWKGHLLGYAKETNLNLGVDPNIRVKNSLAVAFRGFGHGNMEIWKNGISSSVGSTATIGGTGTHEVKVEWSAITHTLTVDWDNDGIDLTFTEDIVNTIFGGDPSNIIWGFTASTGGFTYKHQVCDIQMLEIPTNSSVEYCASDNSTVLYAGNYASYAWSNGMTSQTISATAGTYTVTVSNSNSCTGTDQVNVIANPNPVPAITGNLTYPSGGNTTLNAGNWSSYAWSNNQTSQIITATAGIYTVTVSNSNGCTGTATAQVMVATSCSAEAGILSSNVATICSGDAVELQTTGEETATNYLQYFIVYSQDNLGNTTFVSSQAAVNSSASFASLAGGDYLVCAYNEDQNASPNPSPLTTTLDNIYDTGTTQTGCFDIECTIFTIPESMTVGSATGQANENNAAGSNIYIAEVCGGTAPYNIDFDSSGGFANVETFPSPTVGCIKYRVEYVDATDWTLTVEDAHNCSNPSMIFSHEGQTSVSLPQIVNHTTTNETCVGENNGSITIEVEGGDSLCGDYTYDWSGPSNFISTTMTVGTTGHTLSGLTRGVYDVIVTDCAGTTTMATISVSRNRSRGRGRGRGACKVGGEENFDNTASLIAYPNPFSQQTSIEFTLTTTSKVWLTVYSIEGKKVAEILQGAAIEGNTAQRFGFDAEELQSGVYILELQTESGLRQHQQLVVLK